MERSECSTGKSLSLSPNGSLVNKPCLLSFSSLSLRFHILSLIFDRLLLRILDILYEDKRRYRYINIHGVHTLQRHGFLYSTLINRILFSFVSLVYKIVFIFSIEFTENQVP